MFIKKTEAIKRFFESDGGRPIENRELLTFMKTDKEGFNEVAVGCAIALGCEIEPLEVA